MSEPKLDWSTAEVRKGRLSVTLDGELPSGWGKSFDAVAHLLNHSDWDKVKLKKGEVRVDGVSPGDEDRLRHFLESVVQQANADHNEDEATQPDADGEADEEGLDDASEPDAEMAERFRAFAGEATDTAASAE